MSTGSVSLDKERLLKYKIYSSALAYPGEKFFHYFPELKEERGRVINEYDDLFRKNDIWLYTLEYTARGEFQKYSAVKKSPTLMISSIIIHVPSKGIGGSPGPPSGSKPV